MTDEKKEGIPSPIPGMGELVPAPVKIDWVKRVAESGGRSIFVPDSLKKRFQDNQEALEKYNASLEKIAQSEITMQMESQNLYFGIREALSKEGREIWLKEIGLDPIALKDGEFVINIRDKN